MFGYLALLAVLVFVLLMCLIIHKGDFFNPSCVVAFTTIFSLIFAIFGLSSWNSVTELSSETIAMVISGVCLFCLGSTVVFLPTRDMSKHRSNRSCYFKLEILDFGKTKLAAISFISLLMFVVLLTCLKRAFGVSTIIDVMQYGHSAFFNNDVVLDGGSYTIAVWTLRIIKVLGIVSAISLAAKIVRKSKGVFLASIPVVVLLASHFFMGSRHNMLLVIITFVVLLYLFFLEKKHENSHKINRAFLLCGAVLIPGVLFAFVSLAPLLGQDTFGNETAYLTYYFGSTIPAANQAIADPASCSITFSDILGMHLFKGFYQTWNSIGFTNYQLPTQIGWCVFNGRFPSNIFSAPFVFCLDFGPIGLFVFSILEGLIYGILYKAIKYGNKSIVPLIAFAFFYAGVFNWYRTEDLLSSDISSVSTYIQMLIAYLIINDFRITVTVGSKHSGAMML